MKRALLTLLMALSPAVVAHPHSFIDMKTALVAQGDTFTGLKMTWTMDEITSADLLYDAGDARPGSVVWKKLAAGVMANVLGQHYFSEVWHNKQRVKFLNLPTEYNLSRNGHKAVLEFILPLAEPPTLTGQHFEILTFDPTYFVDMFYDNPGALTLPPALQGRCRFTLTTPKPNDSLKQYALSLDKADAPAEEMDLGRQFAQTVGLTCQ
ncbi:MULTISPECIES: DUF1007 family protein [Pantoea]|jgi:ABC-type uncharacterized transport system substrate-binding protein|uniref:DUF1007 family protein n=1 Tax=Pantoea anthophila TaxID=470931 RepID=A0ABY2ZDE8_9GAMM|nr:MULTISPECIES: DUF1007 family protein [Pantoea]KAF6661430.1 DUF1007 family protein [Enterobacteriaceae bacterium EKM102V]TPE12084.1 DUF1007 family protein [Pantoea vagans]EIB97931.1 hypothetical protein S7A_05430 [Pantoea sp. Sc1]KAA5975187.1 DUF1007 family protein [Pantoea sp. M_6]KAA5979544.1 DUF1007 family protein [Pantoea sp. M_8]